MKRFLFFSVDAHKRESKHLCDSVKTGLNVPSQRLCPSSPHFFIPSWRKTGARLCKVVILSPIKISYGRHTSCVTYSAQWGEPRLSLFLPCSYLCRAALTSGEITLLATHAQAHITFIKQNISYNGCTFPASGGTNSAFNPVT